MDQSQIDLEARLDQETAYESPIKALQAFKEMEGTYTNADGFSLTNSLKKV